MHKFKITETVNTNVSEKKIRKLHKFATTNSNFKKKSIISAMHHRTNIVHVYQFLTKSG